MTKIYRKILNRTGICFVLLTVSLCCLAQDALAQKVVITYFSQTGHTKAMAEAVAKGARSVAGAEVRLLTIDKTTKDDLLWADAIIIGSPVYSANAPAPVLQALSGWPLLPALKDKIGAAFVTGGWIAGGQELTQIHLLATLLEFGMIIVGGEATALSGGEGTAPFGAFAITGEPPFDSKNGVVDTKFLKNGEALGKRVAERARWFISGKPKQANTRSAK